MMGRAATKMRQNVLVPRLWIQVRLLTDDCNGAVLVAAAEAGGLTGSRVAIETLPPGHLWGAAERARLEAIRANAGTVSSRAVFLHKNPFSFPNQRPKV